MLSNKDCPCCSGNPYESCCGSFLSGQLKPETAEQLMRSRYSAYVEGNTAYLKDTLWPVYQKSFDEIGTLLRAQDSRWLGLEILETQAGKAKDKEGFVLFIAKSVVNGVVHEQREKSYFKKKSLKWFYVRAVPE